MWMILQRFSFGRLLLRARRRLVRRPSRRSFALNALDRKLEPYLDFDRGFFVEAGANDGLRQSNTYYFERYRGWKGLLIEAIPELADRCRVNRPQCVVENCALVATGHPDDRVTMQYCDLMSLVQGGLESPETEALHLDTGRRFLKDNERTYQVSVSARTLSSVLDQHKIAHVDLLSLDVEGYEENVLQGIDFSRHRPDFMLIEVRNRSEIERIVSDMYQPIAILTMNSNYQDILYGLR